MFASIKPQPILKFCESFFGNDFSTAEWLRRPVVGLIPQRARGTISPKKFLYNVDILLTGDAANWAHIYPDACRLLAEEEPTVQYVTVFTDLLQKKFPANPWTVPALVNIEPALLFSSLFKPVPLVSSLIGPTPPGYHPLFSVSQLLRYLSLFRALLSRF